MLVYLNRHRFEKQGILYLFRTKIGLKAMDSISAKLRELVRILAISSIGFAFAGLIFITILILKQVYELFYTKSTLGASPIIPGVPIAGTGLVFPLIIGWVCLFIIIIVHEFSHGIVARAHNIKVKSSGIVFIGPILGAFVEPDEKELKKRDDIQQYSVFAVAPIANIVFAGIAILVLMFITAPLSEYASVPTGIKIDVQDSFPAKESGLKDEDIIVAINSIPTSDRNALFNITKDLKPGDQVTLSTKQRDFTFKAATDPKNTTHGYMGITIKEEVREAKEGYSVMYPLLKWTHELFFWLFFISFNIGLINLLPVYITDGARMLLVSFERMFGKNGRKYWILINNFCLLLVIILIFLPIIKKALT
ncbi:MAG: site-2 protease family protein [Candidatus Woesearchaeota archaeon]